MIYKYFSAILLIIVLWLAYEVKTSNNTQNKNIVYENSDCDIIKWKEKEIVDLDSFYLDGVTIFNTTEEELFKKFGKPISRILLNPLNAQFKIRGKAFDEGEVYSVDYGYMVFEVFMGKAVLTMFNFELSDLEIAYPLFILRNKMRLREVLDNYPMTNKMIFINGNTWSGHFELKSKYGVTRLMLIVDNEKLSRLEVYNFY